MPSLNITDTLLVIALEAESGGKAETLGFDIAYTGVGKVNAAYGLMHALRKREREGKHTRLIINFGTAGSPTLPTHTLAFCDRFVQRDMDASPIGFAVGTTPYDTLPAMITHPPHMAGEPHYICGSGDSFVTGTLSVPCDVVDMEAFAFAQIAHREGIPFAAFKYITDGADAEAAGSWQENVVHAAEAFVLHMRRALQETAQVA